MVGTGLEACHDQSVEITGSIELSNDPENRIRTDKGDPRGTFQ